MIENKVTDPQRTRALSHFELCRVVEYLHANLKGDLSLGVIANMMCISTTYFACLFKRTTGQPLHQYVLQLRVAKAKALLLQSDISIAQISLLVGFHDSSHLIRHFKRLLGTPPAFFRKNHKNVQHSPQ